MNFHLVPCNKRKKKRREGDFLVKFQIRPCRTKEESETCNYLGFESSEQIALIPQTYTTVILSTGVQTVCTGTGEPHSVPRG